MHLLSALQMREVDRVTIEERGVPGMVLMTAAAAAVEARMECDFPAALAGTVGIICGGGNNGGDGLVLARRLAARQVRVRTWLFAPPGRLRGDAATAWAALGTKPQTVLDAGAWAEHRPGLFGCDLLVDALFGTGLVRPLQGWIRTVVEELNREYRGPVVAVDIPSGMSADGEGPADGAEAAVVRAHATVTFTAPKLGHYLSAHSAAVGRLTVAAIGTPDDVVTAAGSCCRVSTAGDCAAFLGPRPPDSHKGRYGHVCLVAGSRGKSGAAVLAGTAALRAGAGLVTVAVPRGILPIVAGAMPELMTEPLPETEAGSLNRLAPEKLGDLLRSASVLALGPGLTQNPEASATVRELIAAAKLPCVLDADGLNAFAGHRRDLRLPGGVLTPHPGEMGRLFEESTEKVQSRRLYYAQRLAAETGAVVVLKGHFSLVAEPGGRVFVNPVDSPGMATAGAGDVLTGIIAGLLAQHSTSPLLETVAAAVYLHGQAGVLAAHRLGEMYMVASDITSSLAEAMACCRPS